MRLTPGALGAAFRCSTCARLQLWREDLPGTRAGYEAARLGDPRNEDVVGPRMASSSPWAWVASRRTFRSPPTPTATARRTAVDSFLSVCLGREPQSLRAGHPIPPK